MLKRLRQRVRNVIVLTALTATIPFISSCKKDELTPTTDSTLSANTLSDATTTSLSLTSANVTCEEWSNVSGNDVAQIPVSTTPTSTKSISAFEVTSSSTANFGRRLKGYVTAPTTGSYTFWIAADDAAELWVSTTSDASKKVKVAYTLSYTNFREFTKYSTQKSAAITLQAGQKYYVEVLQKQGGGDSHVSVQWTLPSGAVECPVAGSSLTTASATATTTGKITSETWTNISGNDVSQVPVSTTANSSTTITSLELTNNTTANQAHRIRGYVTAPTTGSYTFAISGDDAAELWLSTSTDPAKKVKIASFLSWTNFREFTKFATQKSAAITLQAGQQYYIEVLHKQGGGDGHVSVQWTVPGGATESPIPGNRLSPYTGSTNLAASASSTSSAYTAAGVISYENVHDITISGKAIAGGNVPCISLKNCYNVHITNCKLYNSSEVGIYLLNCKNITVDYSYFTNVSTGVYVDHSTEGGIVVNNNQFLNMKGPFPRGQFVQFNNVNGPNSSVSYNKGENVLGQSYPEDAISIYQSNGTTSSPIKVAGNWIRGGGPSQSGGGIMLGDMGGSNAIASDNILVNPGQYGMAIAGGNNNQILNNKIYGKQQSFTNVGIYVNSISGYNATNSTVKGNKVRFYNATNYQNNVWLSSNAQKPAGWDTDNVWGSSDMSESMLPSTFLTYK
ncbi:PA14 domain-containing protein [Mucilaginibacter sp. RS28]|uniref:PA14 domain-containing protein n=1 Tax=Mucilaginibacter straminoryzae TaxID=2932774 RepID=A0A9X1X0U2_9SPHI|nr:PA14 domain-containing protein [Mucilaginibacter straminoryzae]MCJ8208943.1 PA14 domain-containing protein [Mucilaginibacter straminoryzae]